MKLFGTDGVRGVAGESPLDETTILRLGAALVRVLAILAEPREAESEIVPPHVFIPALAVEDLFDDAFSPISESGAGTLAVGIRLQKTLRALSAFHHPEFRAAARHQSRLALARARHALALAEDVAKLEREASAI